MLHRLIAPVLASAIALPAVALDLGAMTEAERELFRAEVRAYLMDNPQVIMDAVQVLQTREAEAKARADLDLVADNTDELFNDGYSWVGGNPDGDIVLVEFLDYRCGYCRRAHDEVAQLLETDGNIKLIVKEFPILGEQSVLASRWAVATKQVAGDDAYKDMNDALMTFPGDFTVPALRRVAETFGLDADAIEARMDAPEVTEEINKTRALAQKMQITGTPTFVMQDELLRGYLPLDAMLALVDNKRS
ncbi:DsbA family protein [Sulfitobacter sp. TSTF-M16]|uniref:DsbA family protein n=1 Tax=Sulfitobacter aestuariivivens TaxID=2766981 RepID=A0A927D0X6_9RHOB|nr:DsbA family protein [Sulfitobacter aestuariivivens]MBD3663045.1 DsbA family protein [Sulfitobacter aestuariivivens]